MGIAACRSTRRAFFLPLLVVTLERAIGAGTNGTVADWASEQELLAHLAASNAAAGEPDQADQLPLVRLCVERSWWVAARELISRFHAQNAARGSSTGGGGAATSIRDEVTALVKDVKHRADALGTFADATYRGQTTGLDEVHCALQWAQSSTTVFLGVKYAARWSAPGAIQVVDVVVNITDCCLVLEGFGHHSSIRKRYVVNLTLFADIVPAKSSWSAASVGRLTATLQKAGVKKWKRLTLSKDKSRHQIGTWLDMEEKWEKELAMATSPPASKAAPSPATARSIPTKPASDPEVLKQVRQALAAGQKSALRHWKWLRKTARRRPGLAVALAACLLSALTFASLLCARLLGCCQRRSPPIKASKAAGLAAMARATEASGEAEPKEAPLLPEPPGAEPADSPVAAAAEGEAAPEEHLGNPQSS